MARQVKEHFKQASIHICAVWLVKARRRDIESVRFWSQILDCKESYLNNLMLQVHKLENPCRAKPVTNELMINIYNQVKDFTAKECKHLLDSSRKVEEVLSDDEA